MGVAVPLSRVQFSRFHSQQVCSFRWFTAICCVC